MGHSDVPDFVQSREWQRPPVAVVDFVQVVDRERRSRPLWKDLEPDHLEVKLADGRHAAFETVEDLISWVDKNLAIGIDEVFVRWTEEGRAASPDMLRIALRIGKPSHLWVGGPDEVGTTGMTELILHQLPADTSPQLEGRLQLDGPRPPSTVDLPTTVDVPTTLSLPERILMHPWVYGTGTAVIAGLILWWILGGR